MPKKGNVKKNKQKKGSDGPMINMMREGLSGMVRRGGSAVKRRPTSQKL